MIQIKNHKVFERLSMIPLHYKLFSILYMLEELVPDPVITSAYRSNEEGVHGANPCRGLDIRSSHLPDTVCQQIEKKINDEWIYDNNRPDKKVCLWHKVGEGAYHFHLQVHPNTRRR